MTDFTLPEASPQADAAFRAGLAAGKFLIQRSKTTGEYNFYPRALSPTTGADDLEWVEASGKGTVYASTIIRRPEKFGGDINNVLIDLDEGPRMFSRIVDVDNEAITIGMKVQAVVMTPDFGPNAKSGEPAVFFKPAE
ncbi:Zn-ribbon domain-containing OB-fold protein [Ruegeria sp. Ofav3-42]|uniref:Zn-ribbon domain-containing OB-fold protein n=1 Tax=Ruegeria sp. Ofav3-42 TaxID=2917759 RepID=UPI001EF6C7ED|nr:OB-fold domain-containing protein [Ruegeria sp. Ofav3-42]MCG7519913.1 OB-fold domain-containing protein [Ruegeria sp. Ofav3-42]